MKVPFHSTIHFLLLHTKIILRKLSDHGIKQTVNKQAVSKFLAFRKSITFADKKCSKLTKRSQNEVLWAYFEPINSLKIPTGVLLWLLFSFLQISTYWELFPQRFYYFMIIERRQSSRYRACKAGSDCNSIFLKYKVNVQPIHKKHFLLIASASFLENLK